MDLHIFRCACLGTYYSCEESSVNASAFGCAHVGDCVDLEKQSTVIDVSDLFLGEHVACSDSIHQVEIADSLEGWDMCFFCDETGVCISQILSQAREISRL